MTISTKTAVTRSQVGPDSAPHRRRLDDQVPGRLVLALAALWIVSLYVVFSLAPAPAADDPTATAIAVEIAFNLAVLATLAGFVMRQRWGLLASAGGGVVFLVGAGLCSLGGHTGGWLVAQYVTGAAILGVSQAVFRRF